jgi:predicted nuclease with TOPRIM domain
VASDTNPLSHIRELVDEERELRARLQKHEISADEEHARLRALEVELDQCWDLLRQRRALRETGGDPREARIRPPDEVEGYLG